MSAWRGAVLWLALPLGIALDARVLGFPWVSGAALITTLTVAMRKERPRRANFQCAAAAAAAGLVVFDTSSGASEAEAHAFVVREAVRRHVAANGHPPTALSTLVPQYLRSVPRSTRLTSGTFRYHLNRDGGWCLQWTARTGDFEAERYLCGPYELVFGRTRLGHRVIQPRSRRRGVGVDLDGVARRDRVTAQARSPRCFSGSMTRRP